MTEVWVGLKDCGCLVVISFDRDWIEEDYLVHRMNIEEAKIKLKRCECLLSTETNEVKGK